MPLRLVCYVVLKYSFLIFFSGVGVNKMPKKTEIDEIFEAENKKSSTKYRREDKTCELNVNTLYAPFCITSNYWPFSKVKSISAFLCFAS